MSRIHNIPLLLLVVIAAGLAVLFWALGFTWLAEPILMPNFSESRYFSFLSFLNFIPEGTYFLKSIASLAKDALFVPLKPLMYALIILSIGSSLAISTGAAGAKFIRVLGFFIGFSLIGMAIAIVSYFLFSGQNVFPSQGVGGELKNSEPFMAKIYGVVTSALMISIYTGIILGSALKRLGLGREADKISDLFIAGFRKFLQYTIPLAVFGGITIALADEQGVANLGNLSRILLPYGIAMGLTWSVIVLVTSRIQGHGIGFVLRAVAPQALVAFSTSSSMATLTATKEACSELGVGGDEATPFFTVGATINMVGTLIGLLLVCLYAMSAFGLEVGLGDALLVGLQSMIFATAAAGTPSASVVLIQDILTSQGVSPEYASFVTTLILTIDVLILDRIRTVLNTQSDSMSTANGLKLYYKTPKTLVDDA